MPAPFAAIEANIAADTMRMLANAIVTVGEVEIPAIFDRAFVDAMPGFGGIDAAQPVAQLKTADVSEQAITSNTALVIDGTTYYVQRLMPDGTGMTLLRLSLEPA